MEKKIKWPVDDLDLIENERQNTIRDIKTAQDHIQYLAQTYMQDVVNTFADQVTADARAWIATQPKKTSDGLHIVYEIDPPLKYDTYDFKYERTFSKMDLCAVVYVYYKITLNSPVKFASKKAARKARAEDRRSNLNLRANMSLTRFKY